MEPLVTISLKEYEELKSREKPKEDCMLLKQIIEELKKQTLLPSDMSEIMNNPKNMYIDITKPMNLYSPIYQETEKKASVRIIFEYDKI